jgi:hypothetical protein
MINAVVKEPLKNQEMLYSIGASVASDGMHISSFINSPTHTPNCRFPIQGLVSVTFVRPNIGNPSNGIPAYNQQHASMTN